MPTSVNDCFDRLIPFVSVRTLTMRILFFGNNVLALKVVSWLRDCNEEIVGVVVHPEKKRKRGQEIIDQSGVAGPHVFNAEDLERAEVLKAIGKLKPDIGVSVLFGYILRPKLVSSLPAGCVNLHPSYLPYNRGAYPNVWSIVEGTPAGVTVHYMDAGIDTGDIIARKEVPVEPVDTGQTLYRKLEDAAYELFVETWPRIRAGDVQPVSQQKMKGTYHRASDVHTVDEIKLDQTYTGRELIDIIRARTFPPYEGAFFNHGGRRVYLRLALYYGESAVEEQPENGS